jgi:hypothetical protein
MVVLQDSIRSVSSVFARLAGGFSGISGALRALTPLSIRQRSEMPKKVKIKLGGHGESKVCGKKG